MKHAELNERANSFHSTLATASRCYRLGDDHAVEVCVSASGRHFSIRRQDDDDGGVYVHLIPLVRRPADEDGSEGFERAELEDLTPEVLVRYAEVVGTVTQWKTGKLDELPPSTVVATHRMWGERRRLPRLAR